MDARAPRSLRLCIVLMLSMLGLTSPAPEPPTTKPGDAQLDALVKRLTAGSYDQQQAAMKEVVALGEAAAPALAREMIDHPTSGFFTHTVLQQMGPQTRRALPLLMAAAQDRESPGRRAGFVALRDMPWAA